MHPGPGCLPCKARKKRCNIEKPTCKGCQYNYLVCVWPPERQQRPNRSGIPLSALSIFSVGAGAPEQNPDRVGDKRGTNHKSRRIRRSLLVSSTIPHSLSTIGPMKAESRYLLDHYRHRTGRMASAHIGQYTPFIDALLPIAHSSVVLLDSILTFSSFHLASSGSALSPVNILEYHAVALRGLKYGITRYLHGDKDFGMPLFLAMLMMCCVELANGEQGECSFQHLNAIRGLAPDVLSRMETAPESYKPAIRLGTELYAYFLTLSSICSLESAEDSAIIHESMVIFSAISEHGYTGALFGCSDELFCQVPEAVYLLKESRKLHALCSYQHMRSSSDQSQASLDELFSLRSNIAFLLTKASLWEPPRSSDNTFEMSGRILQLALTAILVEASHWCDVEYYMAPIMISETLKGTAGLELRISPLVAKFIEILEKLPVQSWIVTTMCWSIVVLGSYTTLPQHRDIIRRYLIEMEKHFGFQNMTQSRLLLEHLWSKVAIFEIGRPVAIPDAMTETGGRFMLG